MAIQVLSSAELEVVSGGLNILGLDVGAILGAIVTPTVDIIVTTLNVINNALIGIDTILGSVFTSLNNVIVGLGL